MHVKSVLTNEFTYKWFGKKVKLVWEENKCRYEGAKSLPPRGWFGALWFLEGLSQPAVKVLHKTRAGKSTQSQKKKKGVHTAAWHSPSSPHPVVTAPAACDQRALEAAAATQPWWGATAALPAPSQLSLRKGETGAGGGGGDAPCKAASPCRSKEPLGMGTRLFWRGDSLRSLKTERKGEKPAESIKGWGVL